MEIVSDDDRRLRLRSIHDLLTEHFFVPRYQRGYRWEVRQVEALLNDLEAFQFGSRQADPNTFYCLQPVVVRHRPENVWELVDGQQRLTTIFLILRALREVANILKLGCYKLTYDTREEGLAEFLNQPTAEDAGLSINKHYVYNAYQAIERWFSDRDGLLRLRLLDCLTGPDGTAPNVRVIWYELDDNQPPVEAFVRLNVGRIPLTSAELIRAQLLRDDRKPLDARDAQQIPQDWDLIERRLQDDGYWYFLQSGKSAPPARIEYLFDVFIRTRRAASTDPLSDDPLATFLAFQKLLDAEGAGVGQIWQEFKKLALTLEEWYEDRTLYHLVGFLVATAASDTRPRQAEARVLLDLLDARSNSTGTDFDRHLRRLAWRRFAGLRPTEPSTDVFASDELTQRIAQRLEELEYGHASVRAVLLLFNIAGLLDQTVSTQRFQFDAYKTNSWDIEHVRSVAEYVPGAAGDRRHWLEHAREFVVSPVARALSLAESESLGQQIAALVAASSPEERAFMNVFERVRALSGEAEASADDDALSNLALLDMGTNRSYKNAIFPVKRSRIIELDKRGQFVPPATRNVFLKYYSPHAAQLMLWDQTDQNAYGTAIEETFSNFFTSLVQNKGEE